MQSLRDKLLKAGLVTEEQVAKVEQGPKKRRRRRGGKDTEAKAEAPALVAAEPAIAAG